MPRPVAALEENSSTGTHAASPAAVARAEPEQFLLPVRPGQETITPAAARTERPVEDSPDAPSADGASSETLPKLLPAPAAEDTEAEKLPVPPADDAHARQVDFAWALSLAAGQNPRVAFANARIREAFAQLDFAQTLWLPDLKAGTSYYRHDGTLQPAQGTVQEISRGTYYTGFGARASGTGSPAFPGVLAEFHAADAYFQPRIAGQTAQARRHEATAETNDVLMDTALAYLDLLEALQTLAIAHQTLEAAEKLDQLTRNFAEAGEGPQADADRARTELTARRNDVLRAEEQVRVASARLAQQLSLDASTPLVPSEDGVVPIDLVPRDADLRGLVQTALSNRPELSGSRRLVAAAVERLRREKAAPLVPSVVLAASYGGFGGGRNDALSNYDDRLDFDAVAYWNVRNLGFGERAARKEARARLHQARATVVRAMDQVAREVVETHAQAGKRFQQIDVARQGVESAEHAFERDMNRIREGEGLPIEALQSLRALDGARRAYLRAIVDYDEAQFRLQRALGWPVEPVLDSATP